MVIYGYHSFYKFITSEPLVGWYWAPRLIWVSSVDSFEGRHTFEVSSTLKFHSPSEEVNKVVADKTCIWAISYHSGLLHCEPLIGQDTMFKFTAATKAPYKLFSIEDHQVTRHG